MIEPGKYSFYVGKRPQIAHCQLQQYYDTAAIACLQFAVSAGTKFSAWVLVPTIVVVGAKDFK